MVDYRALFVGADRLRLISLIVWAVNASSFITFLSHLLSCYISVYYSFDDLVNFLTKDLTLNALAMVTSPISFFNFLCINDFWFSTSLRFNLLEFFYLNLASRSNISIILYTASYFNFNFFETPTICSSFFKYTQSSKLNI